MTALLRSLGLSEINPFRKFGIGALACLLAGVVGLLSLAFGADPWLVTPVAAALVIFGLGLLAWSALQGGVYARDMQRMAAGNAWAYWRYDPAEWRRFAEQEWARSRRETWQVLVFGAALGVVVGAAFGLLAGSGAAFGLAVAAFAVAAVLAALASYWAGRDRYARREQEGCGLYVSAIGVYQPGRYSPLRGFNLRPVGGRVEPGTPAALVLTTRMRTRYGYRDNDVRVAIPGGREAEAEALLQRFRAEYGWKT